MRRAAGLLLVAAAACAEAPSNPKTPARPALRVASSSVAASYRLSVPAPSTHYVEVQASFPARGQQALTLMLPVWTPGSYKVREYARHVDQVQAQAPDGRRLAVRKVNKNRWRVQLDGAPQARLRYRVYANEPTVRTSYVDDAYLVLAGAATFLTDPSALDAPHVVELDLEGYEDVAVALPRSEDGRLVAEDYDALVDAPIVAGALRRLPFEVEGVPHELVQLGGRGQWPDARAARDVAGLTRTLADFWGQVPYPRYLFLNVLGLGRGGLEHRGCTLMMRGAMAARTEAGYRRWLGLVAHEHFHTWNGKRLRPRVLGPFDYEREVYTHALWFVEGLTSYYDDLLVRRAGLSTEAQYLEALSGQIQRLEHTPGRLQMPLARASFEAWIEFYRRDESSENTTISYYNKGAVAGFVLDMAIRDATGGYRSLDHVMRRLYADFSGAEGYTTADLYAAFEAIGGEAVRELAVRLVETTEEVEYRGALAWVGLRFAPEAELPSAQDEAARREALRKRAWLGLESEGGGGRTVISRVVAGGPAEKAGLQAGDELIALDGYRVAGPLAERVQLYLPGDELGVLVARHGRMRTLRVQVGTQPRRFRLQIDPRANHRARRHRADWLELTPR